MEGCTFLVLINSWIFAINIIIALISGDTSKDVYKGVAILLHLRTTKKMKEI